LKEKLRSLELRIKIAEQKGVSGRLGSSILKSRVIIGIQRVVRLGVAESMVFLLMLLR
jgi:hypothetical protein